MSEGSQLCGLDYCQPYASGKLCSRGLSVRQGRAAGTAAVGQQHGAASVPFECYGRVWTEIMAL
jgi:hypothetical protein